MTALKTANVNVIASGNFTTDLLGSCSVPFVSRLLLSLFLAALILVLSYIRTPTSNIDEVEVAVGSGLTNFELAEILFHDLAHEGIAIKGNKVLIISSEVMSPREGFRFLNDCELDITTLSSIESRSSVLNGKFNLIVLSGLSDRKVADRLLKVGGIMITQMHGHSLNIFHEPSNYQVVSLRKFLDPINIVAMKKIALSNDGATVLKNRKLCNFAADNGKRAALKSLETPLLEPPRRALLKSGSYLKKIKYLPILFDDNLDGYTRCIFITMGIPEDNKRTVQWFQENYPSRNRIFEVYSLETDPVTSHIDVSEWLMKNNIREEDYVVMKAEAGAVEEMIKKKAIHLVDELFLECKNRWGFKERNKSKRAYWECLSLYGRLIDEGVAVHQWWG